MADKIGHLKVDQRLRTIFLNTDFLFVVGKETTFSFKPTYQGCTYALTNGKVHLTVWKTADMLKAQYIDYSNLSNIVSCCTRIHRSAFNVFAEFFTTELPKIVEGYVV